MYESIQGVLKEKEPHKAVVETHGIAYRLHIPLSAFPHLPHLEKMVFFYLTQVVREDAHTLYAFLSKEERDLFETLITLSGIGPKTALALVGHVEIGAFQRAIASSDIRFLSKIPGIGKKTAERLVIEMKDKVKGIDNKVKGAGLAFSGDASVESDARQALIHLGYNPLQAQKAVFAAMQEKKEEQDVGNIIALALQKL